MALTQAEIMRRRRQDPQKRALDYAIRDARERALKRLAQEHPDAYRRLLNEERAAVGLPPVRALTSAPTAPAGRPRPRAAAGAVGGVAGSSAVPARERRAAASAPVAAAPATQPLTDDGPVREHRAVQNRRL